MMTILRIILIFLFSTSLANAEPICIIVAAPAQSNGSGQGEIAQSPPVPIGGVFRFDGTNIVNGTDDPGGNGSMWPALASAFYLKTGIKVLWIGSSSINSGFMTDVAAQAELPTPGNSWDVNGPGIPAALTLLDHAKAAAIALGYKPSLCAAVAVQGESEAKHIALGLSLVSLSDWVGAFKNAQRRIREHENDNTLFVVIRSGTTTGTISNYEPGFVIIRAAQEIAVQTDHATIMGSRSSYFCAGAFGLLQDIHYNQKCLNMIGYEAGSALAATGRWKAPETSQ